MQTSRRRVALFLSLLVCAAGLRAATYTVQTLAYPGATQTYAQAINSSGVVAGYYTDTSGTSHGFTWRAGTFTPLDIPGASGTWLTGINNSDVVCGYFHVAAGNGAQTVGFTLSSGILTEFKGSLVSRGTFPAGINKSGVISGYNETGSLAAGVFGGFLLSSASGGKTTPLTISGETNTWAAGLNDSSDVVGFAGADLNPTTPVEAFVYKGSTGAFTIENMPAMVQTRFYGINDLGAIVGYGLDSNQITNSFLFRNGTYQAFTLPGYTVAIPQGISNAGTVVGYAITPTESIVGFVAVP